MIEYSESFERDFNWYMKLSNRKKFNFDGNIDFFKRTIKIFKQNIGQREFELFDEIPFTVFKERYPNMVHGNVIQKYSNGWMTSYMFELCSYPIIVKDIRGVTAKEAFYCFDSKGEIVPTRQPKLLAAILKVKGSLNFNIKMWAESRADGTLPKVMFSEKCKQDELDLFKQNKIKSSLAKVKTIEKKCKLLSWMVDAVENQKSKYYP